MGVWTQVACSSLTTFLPLEHEYSDTDYYYSQGCLYAEKYNDICLCDHLFSYGISGSGK